MQEAQPLDRLFLALADPGRRGMVEQLSRGPATVKELAGPANMRLPSALKHLKEGACIINSGSITGMRGSKHLMDYAATKGAIHAFTKSLAQVLVDKKIRVNCVAPGPIWTPFIPSTSAEKAEEHGESVPFKRPGQPEEVAPSYVFFASEGDSSYITGEVLTVLGGEQTTW